MGAAGQRAAATLLVALCGALPAAQGQPGGHCTRITPAELVNLLSWEGSPPPPDCVALAPPAAFGVLTAEHMRNLGEGVGALTAAQIAALPPAACSGLSKNQQKLLQPQHCAVVAPECAGALRRSGEIGEECSKALPAPGARPPALPAGGANAPGGGMGRPLRQLTRSEPRPAPPPFDCRRLRPEDYERLGSRQGHSCAVLTADCLGATSEVLLHKLSAACVRQISPQALRRLAPKKVAALSDDAFAVLRPAQAAALGSACGLLTGEELEGMKPATCAALTTACTDSVAAEAVQWSPECVLALKPEAFGALTPAAIRALTSDAFCRVPASFYAAMAPQLCASLTKNQAAKIPRGYCSGLSLACRDQMQPEARALLVDGCDPERQRSAPGPAEPAFCDHSNWDDRRIALKERMDKRQESTKRASEGKSTAPTVLTAGSAGEKPHMQMPTIAEARHAARHPLPEEPTRGAGARWWMRSTVVTVGAAAAGIALAAGATWLAALHRTGGAREVYAELP
eukprot:TRINITY_DN55650_c0_g1_i1.p1 TRINITY_DN55650_c0_g1~~TRINITY_DN55650_c0_g1_i1.p1  ORF type:complete len:514 (+),score=144.12 TRINITY_DN55650_c0_g1_i1:117-1658(+)